MLPIQFLCTACWSSVSFSKTLGKGPSLIPVMQRAQTFDQKRSVGKTHTHTSPLRSRAPHASGGLPLGDCCSHCPPRSSLSWFAIGLDIRRLLLVLRSVFFRPGWAPVTFTGPYNSGFTVGWYTGWAPDLFDPLQQIRWCILGLECC